ncbi:MAG: carboxymuconolactone decarboxylase family protein [Bacteroidetes bacterium]|nr:carboxymuconolactone decarboxylase family protein [Bacteroidota bacterium]
MDNSSVQTPMDLMKVLSPEGTRTYMDHRAQIMDNPALQSLTAEQKLLIGIGVASALQSSTCTMMWTKQAVKAGVSTAEIMEAILVARLMKMATVNDTAAEAMAWLQSGDR